MQKAVYNEVYFTCDIMNEIWDCESNASKIP